MKKMQQGLKKMQNSSIKCGKFGEKNAACIIPVNKQLGNTNTNILFRHVSTAADSKVQ